MALWDSTLKEERKRETGCFVSLTDSRLISLFCGIFVFFFFLTRVLPGSPSNPLSRLNTNALHARVIRGFFRTAGEDGRRDAAHESRGIFFLRFSLPPSSLPPSLPLLLSRLWASAPLARLPTQHGGSCLTEQISEHGCSGSSLALKDPKPWVKFSGETATRHV